MRPVHLMALALALTPLLLAAHPVSAQEGTGSNVAGIGVFPSTVGVENALRGERYEQGTTLLNSASEERIFALEAQGEFAEWVTFAAKDKPETLLTEVTVPPQGETHIWVYITVPDGTPNGDYTGEISYASRSATSEARVVLGITQGINVSVTGEQVLDVRLGDIFLRNIEVGQPLRVETRIVNQSNITVTPSIVASIVSSAGIEVASDLQARTEPFKSGEEKSVVALEWDSSGQQPGDYVLKYQMLAQGEEFANGELPFTLAAFGSLDRGGEIVSIEFAGQLTAGTVGRADISFRNTGATDVQAEFLGDLYRDGDLIGPVESRLDVLVTPGNIGVLNAFFDIDESGTYELRGRVHFAGISTDEMSASFSTPGAGWSLPTTLIAVVAVSAAAALGIVVWRTRLRKPNVISGQGAAS